MSRRDSKVVLITGCSSGIGRSCAESLAANGHIVYATARREDSVDELRGWAGDCDGHAFADRLDVTQPQTIEAVITRVIAEQGRIDVLVNNAGFGQPGAIEDVTRDRWQAQFDTNVFGLLDVTRAVLPHMRARRSGRIVNISSVVAHIVLPLMGAYGASKHAVDAINTALRMELKPWSIGVVTVEPGPIRTDFRANVERSRPRGIEPEDSAYRQHYRAMELRWKERFENAGVPVERVASAVRRAVEARRPKTRYRVTGVAHWAPALCALLGDRLSDNLMLRSLGLNRLTAPP